MKAYFCWEIHMLWLKPVSTSWHWFPALENSLSAGTEVPRMHKYFIARYVNFRNWVDFSREEDPSFLSIFFCWRYWHISTTVGVCFGLASATCWSNACHSPWLNWTSPTLSVDLLGSLLFSYLGTITDISSVRHRTHCSAASASANAIFFNQGSSIVEAVCICQCSRTVNASTEKAHLLAWCCC